MAKLVGIKLHNGVQQMVQVNVGQAYSGTGRNMAQVFKILWHLDINNFQRFLLLPSKIFTRYFVFPDTWSQTAGVLLYEN